MSKTIFKYPIKIEKNTTLELPKGAEVLTCQVDQKTETPCIWVKQERHLSGTLPEQRTFLLFGTGHDLPHEGAGELKYISTIQLHEGELILHLFELC